MVIISIETLQSFTCGFMFSPTTPFVLSRLIRHFLFDYQKRKKSSSKMEVFWNQAHSWKIINISNGLDSSLAMTENFYGIYAEPFWKCLIFFENLLLTDMIWLLIRWFGGWYKRGSQSWRKGVQGSSVEGGPE